MGAHHHGDKGNSRRVRLALALTAAFMFVEVAGGILSGSLALLADAGHMLTDTMALALAALAFHVSARPADSRRSYGYHRTQVLAAFVNSLALIAIVAWIFVEAARRFLEPTEVQGMLMLYVAAAGLVVNIAAFLILHGGDRDNLNMRAAALHVLGDLLGSVAAIAAAVVILLTGWMPIDPLLSLVVALLILRSAWHLLKHSAHVLLEGSPDWLDVKEMQASLIRSIPEIESVHHVHVWGLTMQKLMLTMHVTLAREDYDAPAVVRKVKERLSEDYGITHSTIEVEAGICADRLSAGS